MRRPLGIVVRLLALAAVATGGGWLIWRSRPPFTPGTHTVEAARPVAAAPADVAPKIGNCPVFPPDNVWNTPVDTLPKDPQSDNYIAKIGVAQRLHPDFGPDMLSGIPYSEVTPGTPFIKLPFGYADESDSGEYPMPVNPAIEGGRDSTGDRHLIQIDLQHCIDYEVFDLERQPDDSWGAGSGVKWDLRSNALRRPGTSADAAGLPVFSGLVRFDEVASGQINHALRFTIPHTRNALVWPARHKASRIDDPNVAPMGQRFRLRADYNISGFSKPNQVILTALKKYGMFLADNGGAMFISGAPDKRWDDGDLHDLSRVHAEDFEAVDESAWANDKTTAVVRH